MAAVTTYLVLEDFCSSVRQLFAGQMVNGQCDNVELLKTAGLNVVEYDVTMAQVVERYAIQRNASKTQSNPSLASMLLAAGFFQPPSADSASLLVLQFDAGQLIRGHRAVSALDGLLYETDPTSVASICACVGVVESSHVPGEEADAIAAGKVIEGSWAWTPNRPVFAGLGGLLTQDPDLSINSLIVAQALTPTMVFVSLRDPILREA